MRKFCLLLCIVFIFFCVGCEKSKEQDFPSTGISEPYRVGLQVESDGYVRLVFATLISYDWRSTEGYLPGQISKQYSLIDLATSVTQIAASHTDGKVVLSLSDTVINCEVYRWEPSTPNKIFRIPLKDNTFSLCSNGSIYIYEIITMYEKGFASFLFLETP